MTKKTNLWIVGILALVVGYFLGDFIGVPAMNDELLSGDVAKADLYKGQKVDPETAAIVEKLQSDTAFCNLTGKALMALKERVDGAQALAERTASMCCDVPELQNVFTKIESLQAKAYNAALSLEKANAELAKISNGEKSDVYEQASNNAYICYSKAESQVNVGKDVFTAISAYLKDKEGPEAAEMAQLAADWSKYCIQDAVINGSETDLAFWSKNLESANGVISECLAKMEKDLGAKLIGTEGNVASLTVLFSDSQKFLDAFLSSNVQLTGSKKIEDIGLAPGNSPTTASSTLSKTISIPNIDGNLETTLAKTMREQGEPLNALGKEIQPVFAPAIAFPTMQGIR